MEGGGSSCAIKAQDCVTKEQNEAKRRDPYACSPDDSSQAEAIWSLAEGDNGLNSMYAMYPGSVTPTESQFDYNGLLQERDSRIQQLETQLLDLKEELQRQHRLVNESQQSYQHLSLERASDKKEMAVIEAENRELTRKLQQVSTSAKNVLAFCDKLKQKEQITEAAKQALENELEIARSNCALLEKDLETSRSKEQSLEAQLAELKKMNETSQGQISSLELEAHKLREVKEASPVLINDPNCICLLLRRHMPHMTAHKLHQLLHRGWAATAAKLDVAVETNTTAMCDTHCQTQDNIMLDNSAQTDLIMEDFIEFLHSCGQEAGIIRHGGYLKRFETKCCPQRSSDCPQEDASPTAVRDFDPSVSRTASFLPRSMKPPVSDGFQAHTGNFSMNVASVYAHTHCQSPLSRTSSRLAAMHSWQPLHITSARAGDGLLANNAAQSSLMKQDATIAIDDTIQSLERLLGQSQASLPASSPQSTLSTSRSNARNYPSSRLSQESESEEATTKASSLSANSKVNDHSKLGGMTQAHSLVTLDVERSIGILSGGNASDSTRKRKASCKRGGDEGREPLTIEVSDESSLDSALTKRRRTSVDGSMMKSASDPADGELSMKLSSTSRPSAPQSQRPVVSESTVPPPNLNRHWRGSSIEHHDSGADITKTGEIANASLKRESNGSDTSIVTGQDAHINQPPSSSAVGPPPVMESSPIGMDKLTAIGTTDEIGLSEASASEPLFGTDDEEANPDQQAAGAHSRQQLTGKVVGAMSASVDLDAVEESLLRGLKGPVSSDNARAGLKLTSAPPGQRLARAKAAPSKRPIKASSKKGAMPASKKGAIKKIVVPPASTGTELLDSDEDGAITEQ